MTAITTDCGITVPAAFALVPAQIPGVERHTSNVRRDKKMYNARDKLGGQDVIINKFDILSDDDDSAGDNVVYSPPVNATLDNLSTASRASDSESVISKTKKTYKSKTVLSRRGNLPDVFWRAIPMSDLRSHPNFIPLPPASCIRHLPTKEHARYFRQESWQWDYLHQGRCTTSQAAAALGFLEPQAAAFLGIPKTLQRGGGGAAWQRLNQDTSNIDELKEMERILCEGQSLNGMNIDNWKPGVKESEKTWIESANLRNKYPFVAKYLPTISDEELKSKKAETQQRMKHTSSSLSTRMHWGNAQEATSILTALNYFCGIDKRTTIHEVGMCGAGFDDDHDSVLNGLKIGASPDAIICHGNGTVEILEVKNHCPFAWNKTPIHGKRNKQRNKKRACNQKKNQHNQSAKNAKIFSIRDFDLECKVPAIYIPQLMMEMLCVGDSVDLDKKQQDKSRSKMPICKSAIMIRQTATRGAIVLRLHRNEEWLLEMKYFLGEFQKRFVDAGVIPPDDFFFTGEDSERYKIFLQMTKDLSESVDQVAYIDHGRIQRMVMNKCASYETPPLFLDYVEETRGENMMDVV